MYVKVNSIFLPIGILNAGLEYEVNHKMTVQGDILISPWKSLFGNNAQLYMGTMEVRYYYNEVFRKFYVGVNLGSAAFNIQKWNYLNTRSYQKGFTIFGGVTVGYQFQLSENWNMDLYLGAGTLQSFYKGFNKDTNLRYDNVTNWNKSGEFLPYRGGLMIAYKLK